MDYQHHISTRISTERETHTAHDTQQMHVLRDIEEDTLPRRALAVVGLGDQPSAPNDNVSENPDEYGAQYTADHACADGRQPNLV